MKLVFHLFLNHPVPLPEGKKNVFLFLNRYLMHLLATMNTSSFSPPTFFTHKLACDYSVQHLAPSVQQFISGIILYQQLGSVLTLCLMAV